MISLQEHVKWVVSRRLEPETWFRGIPSFLLPTEAMIKCVGIREATATLERWVRAYNHEPDLLTKGE